MPETRSNPKKDKPAPSDHQTVYALMKEMGSRDGYTPIPPDQHDWQRESDEPPKQRMWSWMVRATCFYGRRSPYAVDREGKELHLEHCAKDLGMDMANARHYWAIGVKQGIWRSGDHQEGPRRMYLCGRVPRRKPEDAAEKYVHTFCSASIYKQIKHLDDETQKRIRYILEEESRLKDAYAAAIQAAVRELFIRRQYNALEPFGVKPGLQKHKKQEETDEDAERRRSRIEPILAPLEEYVQTIREYVDSSPEGDVQTSGAAHPYMASENYQRSTVPVGRDMPTPRGVEAHSEGEKPSPKQQPEAKPRDSGKRKPQNPNTGNSENHNGRSHNGNSGGRGLPNLKTEPLTEEEQRAEEVLFTHILNMQVAYPHLDFSKEIVSRSCRNDRLLVWRIMSTVGVANVEQFLVKVRYQLQKLDKNAFGKLPGSAPGPRSLGLLLYWAGQYAEALDEAARSEAEEQKRALTRQLAVCIEILNDPNEDATAKNWAREFLDAHRDIAAA